MFNSVGKWTLQLDLAFVFMGWDWEGRCQDVDASGNAITVDQGSVKIPAGFQLQTTLWAWPR